MGPLTLPQEGPIYLDASGFIYSVERIQPYSDLLDQLWRQAQTGQFSILSSDLVVLETLVRLPREGDAVLEGLFRSLFDAAEVTLVPVTRQLWEDAAGLRATTGLKTPDALHAAAAIHAQCTFFITNDYDFRRLEGLPVVFHWPQRDAAALSH